MPAAKGELKKLGVKQRYQMMKEIEGNGQLVDGEWVYAPGWSDEKIATLVGVPKQSVRYHRGKAFGPLKTVKKISETEARFEALEARIAELEANTKRQVDVIERAINTLLRGHQDRSSVSKEKIDELVMYFGRGKNNGKALVS
jgi:uncharacterized coiled-coil protein SlyX